MVVIEQLRNIHDDMNAVYQRAVAHPVNHPVWIATEGDEIYNGWITIWQKMELARGVENSARRAGFIGCIYGEQKCPPDGVMFCDACTDNDHLIEK